MRKIPEMTRHDVLFGNIKHMPDYDTLPKEFKSGRSNPYCRACGAWLFIGSAAYPNGILIDGTAYTAKDGVDAAKAIRAIKAILVSFDPPHEQKIAACGFLLSEWFDKV
jgi:hypothetical protein